MCPVWSFLHTTRLSLKLQVFQKNNLSRLLSCCATLPPKSTPLRLFPNASLCIGRKLFHAGGVSSNVDMLGKFIRSRRNKLTYYHLHVLYFIMVALIGTLIFWSLGTKESTQKHFPWLDCLYTVISGLCLGGLSAIPIESISSGGHLIILFMMILGGQIFTSLLPLVIRRKRYCSIVKTALRPSSHPVTSSVVKRVLNIIALRTDDDLWMENISSKKHVPEPLKLVFLEHRAVCSLTGIVVRYYFGVQLLGFLVAWLCIVCDDRAKTVLRGKEVNSGFFALFAVVSAFSNTGFVISNQNMAAFNTSTFLLLDLWLVTFLGNTLFPVALRGIIWLLHRYSDGAKRSSYALLLDCPRKYYQHLFPRVATLWLSLSVLGLNSVGCLVFYSMDWNNQELKHLGIGQKIVNGMFQTVNSRSGGMNSVNLVKFSSALLFVYCVMMYIEAYPVSLKEEQSKEDDTSVCTQTRRRLTRDPAYLIFLVLLICISLNSQMKQDPLNFNVFYVLFEVASAYGCVGLTVGYSCNLRVQLDHACKDLPISFSGKWNARGKILIIAVMMLGRHRGLPEHIESTTETEKLILLLRTPSFIALTQQQPAQDPSIILV